MTTSFDVDMVDSIERTELEASFAESLFLSRAEADGSHYAETESKEKTENFLSYCRNFRKPTNAFACEGATLAGNAEQICRESSFAPATARPGGVVFPENTAHAHERENPDRANHRTWKREETMKLLTHLLALVGLRDTCPEHDASLRAGKDTADGHAPVPHWNSLLL